MEDIQKKLLEKEEIERAKELERTAKEQELLAQRQVGQCGVSVTDLALGERETPCRRAGREESS